MPTVNRRKPRRVKKEKERKEIRTRGEDFVTDYSNTIHIRITPYDFAITFGQIVEVDEEKISIDDRVRIMMSPQHAMSFCKVLEGQIEEYLRRHAGPEKEVKSPGRTKPRRKKTPKN